MIIVEKMITSSSSSKTGGEKFQMIQPQHFQGTIPSFAELGCSVRPDGAVPKPPRDTFQTTFGELSDEVILEED